jgi:hypothetical protein
MKHTNFKKQCRPVHCAGWDPWWLFRKAVSYQLLAVSLFLALTVHAQIIYTSPQTTQQQVFTAVNASGCSAPVRNIGQSIHSLTYTTAGFPTTLQIYLEGAAVIPNYVRISEIATNVISGGTFATIYLPFVRACIWNIQPSGGAANVTVEYSGTSVGGPATGIFALSGTNSRVLAFDSADKTSFPYTVELPRSGTGGVLFFRFNSVACVGSTLTVYVFEPAGGASAPVYVVYPARVLQNVTATQMIVVPALPAVQAQVTYTTGCGGAGAGDTYRLFWVFPDTSANDVIVCNRSAAFTLPGIGSTEIVPLANGQSIYVCDVSLSLTAPANITINQGTGAACVVNPVLLAGPYPLVLSMALDFPPHNPLRGNFGQALCVNLGAAATGGGMVKYAQF